MMGPTMWQPKTKKPMLFSRLKQLISSKTKKQGAQDGLEYYDGDEAFRNAAERHGETAETMLDEPYQSVSQPRSISSSEHSAQDSGGTVVMTQMPVARSLSSDRSELQVAPCRKFQKPSLRWLERCHPVKSINRRAADDPWRSIDENGTSNGTQVMVDAATNEVVDDLNGGLSEEAFPMNPTRFRKAHTIYLTSAC